MTSHVDFDRSVYSTHLDSDSVNDQYFEDSKSSQEGIFIKAVIIAFQSATLPKTHSFRSENMPEPQRDDRLSTPTFRVIFPVGKAAQGSCGAYSPGRPGTQVHEKFETAGSLN